MQRLRLIALLAPSLALAACAGGGGGYRAVSDVPVRIGPPYKVRGETYTPRAQPGYDMLGYATWYGNESGNRTASGEKFRADWITAAHRDLPLPTYLEVTSLDSGERIIVRVNDRGPFGQSEKILDLSRGAAEQLGVRAKGKAPVRVRVIEPERKDRERLMKGKPARSLPRLSDKALTSLRAQFARGVGTL